MLREVAVEIDAERTSLRLDVPEFASFGERTVGVAEAPGSVTDGDEPLAERSGGAAERGWTYRPDDGTVPIRL